MGLRLTKQTGYAIKILVDCARAEGQLVKTSDLSKRLGITKQNALKIVHILSQAGFVAPVRGPSGGVRLAKPARDMRIGEVVRSIESLSSVTNDTNEAHEPRIGGLFDDALEAFISVLDQQSVLDLVRASQPGVQDALGASRPARARRTAERSS